MDAREHWHIETITDWRGDIGLRLISTCRHADEIAQAAGLKPDGVDRFARRIYALRMDDAQRFLTTYFEVGPRAQGD